MGSGPQRRLLYIIIVGIPSWIGSPAAPEHTHGHVFSIVQHAVLNYKVVVGSTLALPQGEVSQGNPLQVSRLHVRCSGIVCGSGVRNVACRQLMELFHPADGMQQ